MRKRKERRKSDNMEKRGRRRRKLRVWRRSRNDGGGFKGANKGESK